jgi:hypothetical protein
MVSIQWKHAVERNITTEMEKDIRTALICRSRSGGGAADPGDWNECTKNVIHGLLTSEVANGPKLGKAMYDAVDALDFQEYEKFLSLSGYEQIWKVTLLLDSPDLLPEATFEWCRSLVGPKRRSFEECLLLASKTHSNPIIALLGTLTLLVHECFEKRVQEQLCPLTARKNCKLPLFLTCAKHYMKLDKPDKIVNFDRVLQSYGAYRRALSA